MAESENKISLLSEKDPYLLNNGYTRGIDFERLNGDLKSKDEFVRNAAQDAAGFLQQQYTSQGYGEQFNKNLVSGKNVEYIPSFVNDKVVNDSSLNHEWNDMAQSAINAPADSKKAKDAEAVAAEQRKRDEVDAISKGYDPDKAGDMDKYYQEMKDIEEAQQNRVNSKNLNLNISKQSESPNIEKDNAKPNELNEGFNAEQSNKVTTSREEFIVLGKREIEMAKKETGSGAAEKAHQDLKEKLDKGDYSFDQAKYEKLSTYRTDKELKSEKAEVTDMVKSDLKKGISDRKEELKEDGKLDREDRKELREMRKEMREILKSARKDDNGYDLASVGVSAATPNSYNKGMAAEVGKDELQVG